NYTSNMRILNIDIETLDPKEPVVSQLYREIEKDLKQNPKYKNEDHFVLGYLLQIQDQDEDAHAHFQEISQDSPLYGTALFFDGISLRKMGENSKNDSNQEKYCKESMDHFDKINDLTPIYFTIKQPRELSLSTFCYFDALVKKEPLQTQDEIWFRNVLK